MPEGIVAYQIKDGPHGDSWKNIVVIFNGKEATQQVEFPKNNWVIVANGDSIKPEGINSFHGESLAIPGTSALILVDERSIRESVLDE